MSATKKSRGAVREWVEKNQRPCITRRWTHAVICLGWLISVESLVEVEAAKGVPYRRPILRAAQLWYEVYCSCRGEGFRCNVLHRRRPLNFQYPVRAEPLVFLTSLWEELSDWLAVPFANWKTTFSTVGVLSTHHCFSERRSEVGEKPQLSHSVTAHSPSGLP